MATSIPSSLKNRQIVLRSHPVGEPKDTDFLPQEATIPTTLEEGKILLKTFARGLTKYLAEEKAEDQGWLAGVLANVVNSATETADTRSWLTLPNTIGLARLNVPAGTYDLEVESIDADGAVDSVPRLVIPGVEVRAGDWTFVSQRLW